MDHFANFHIATFYLRQPLDQDDLKAIRFHPGEQGANIWFVQPNDEGVFHGAKKTKGICHVHPVQIYLDLKGHPERSKEAADHLRDSLLNWK